MQRVCFGRLPERLSHVAFCRKFGTARPRSYACGRRKSTIATFRIRRRSVGASFYACVCVSIRGQNISHGSTRMHTDKATAAIPTFAFQSMTLADGVLSNAMP